MVDDKVNSGARLIHGSLLRVSVSAISALVGFFMMPFLISQLGAYWYGIWVIIGSLLVNLHLLDFGLTTAVVRNVTVALSADDTDAVNRVISTAFWIFCGIGVVLFLIVFAMAIGAKLMLGPNAHDTISKLMLIMGMSMALGFPFKAMAGLLQSKLRYDLLVGLRFGALVASTGVTIYLLLHGHGLVSLAVAGLFVGIISDLCFVVIVRGIFPKIRVSWRLFNRDIVRQLLSFSIWAFLSQLSNQIRLRTNELVVGGVESAVAVTHFSVGARPTEIAYDFLNQATNIVQPVLTRYHAIGDNEQMRSSILLLTKINVALGVFVCGMLFMLGEPFIVRWMGDGFANTSWILYIMAAALNVEFIVAPLDNALYAVGRPRFLATVNFVDAIANIGLSIWLGMVLGLVGVALGTLIPLICTRFGLIVPYTCRQVGIPIVAYVSCVMRTVIAALVVLVPTTFVVQPFLAGSGYGTFAVIVLLTGLCYLAVIFRCSFNLPERNKLLDSVLAATRSLGR